MVSWTLALDGSASRDSKEPSMSLQIPPALFSLVPVHSPTNLFISLHTYNRNFSSPHDLLLLFAIVFLSVLFRSDDTDVSQCLFTFSKLTRELAISSKKILLNECEFVAN